MQIYMKQQMSIAMRTRMQVNMKEDDSHGIYLDGFGHASAPALVCGSVVACLCVVCLLAPGVVHGPASLSSLRFSLLLASDYLVIFYMSCTINTKVFVGSIGITSYQH